jgi:hypothetical protein
MMMSDEVCVERWMGHARINDLTHRCGRNTRGEVKDVWT